ncbi:hypothetical protein [Nocardia amamiensis]|uniref:hypothetical protein n=1 Tax=Nocardia amamiensis TaxID=404578 RepID=UPI00082AB73E|nr:hypothetical protein [Nocardia amamiensis]
MTEPFHKPPQIGDSAAPVPYEPPAPHTGPPDSAPANFAPTPRDVAYPPQAIPGTAASPYSTAPQPLPPGYGVPLGYPPQPYYPVPPQMPIVSVTQNNTSGGVVYVRPGVNHGLHLVLTLLTCGMWAPIWIILWVVDAVSRK